MTTMMGFVITIPNDDHPYDNTDDNIYHHQNNPSLVVVDDNTDTIAEEMESTNHVWIKTIKQWCCGCCCTTTSNRRCRFPSTVVLVSWSLIFGGIFCVGASVLVKRNLFLSDILNAISVHLFFIQACAMYYTRFSGWRDKKSTTPNEGNTDSHRCIEQQQQHLENDTDANDEDVTDEDTTALRMDAVLLWWYIIGDTAFGLGALIDVIISYVYLVSTAYFVQAIVTIVSGILWWVSSILYGLATLYDYHRLRQDIRNEAKEIDDLLTTTTQNAAYSSRRTAGDCNV